MIDFFTTNAWALEDMVYHQLLLLVERHLEGTKLDRNQVEDIAAARDARLDDRGAFKVAPPAGVAVVPITGVIAKYSSSVNGSSQPSGTSVEEIRGLLQRAVDDPTIKQIALLIDSPGGSVDGVPQLAGDILAARGKKPIVAIADDLMASAAYWLGSHADKVYATPGTRVGSIGVYSVLQDWSRKMQNSGVETIVLRAGKDKGIGAPGAPITDAQRQVVQDRIQDWYELFTSSVAAARGLDLDHVLSIAEGRTYRTELALQHGLIDGILSVGDALRVLATGNPNPAAVAASDQGEQVAVADDSTDSEETMSDTKNVSAAGPAPQVATAEDLTRLYPHLAEQLRVEGRNDGTNSERARVLSILGSCGVNQDKLGRELIQSGASRVDALEKINADLRDQQSKRLAQLRAEAPVVNGNNDPNAKGGNTAEEKPEEIAKLNELRAKAGGADDPRFEKLAAAAFAADPKLREEFTTAGEYAGFLMVEHQRQNSGIRRRGA